MKRKTPNPSINFVRENPTKSSLLEKIKKTEDETLFTEKNSESSNHHEKVPHAQLTISIDWFFLAKNSSCTKQSKIRQKFSFLTNHISIF